MKNGKLHVWLPTIRAGSGTDVFTMRLAQAFESRGLSAHINWFAPRHEFAPFLLRNAPMPAGTDIVFANSWNGFAFKRAGIPLVVTSHHPEFTAADPQFGRLRRLYQRTLIRHYQEASFRAADVITTPSAFTARSLQGTAHAGKLKIIYNWIDLAKFSPGERPAKMTQPFGLLFVGNLSYRKGVDLLPAIMRELGSRFHLTIVAKPVGDIEKLKLPNITMPGRLDEAGLVEAYRACDALLFPSRWEGFGYTVLEAMGCGKPVVTSDASALPEVVQDGVTGLLCEAGNTAAFAAACRRLEGDRHLTDAMGIAGRKRAEREFSEEELVSRYTSIIEQLCADGAGRAG